MTKLCFHCNKKAKYERQVIILKNTPDEAKYYDVDGLFTIYECKKHLKLGFESKRLEVQDA